MSSELIDCCEYIPRRSIAPVLVPPPGLSDRATYRLSFQAGTLLSSCQHLPGLRSHLDTSIQHVDRQACTGQSGGINLGGHKPGMIELLSSYYAAISNK